MTDKPMIITDGKMPETRQERAIKQSIHRKALFDGRASAHEVHSKYAFPPNATCSGCKCKGRLAVRAIVLYPLDEMKRRDPLFDTLMGVNPAGFAQTLVQTAYGPFVRVSTAYACKACTPELKKALAKSPSWAIVDINEGPKPDRFVSGRYGGSTID